VRKFLLFIFSLFLFLAFFSFETARPAQAAPCSFSLSDTAIAPGDSFTVTIKADKGTIWTITFGNNLSVPGVTANDSGVATYVRSGNANGTINVGVSAGGGRFATVTCSPSGSNVVSVSTQNPSNGTGATTKYKKTGSIRYGFSCVAATDGTLTRDECLNQVSASGKYKLNPPSAAGRKAFCELDSNGTYNTAAECRTALEQQYPAPVLTGVDAGHEIYAHPSYTLRSSTTDEANKYLYGTVYGILRDDRFESENRAVVTENTDVVEIRFTGLDNSKDYKICLTTKCLLLASPGDGETISNFNVDFLKGAKIVTKRPTNGTIALFVCGDGENALKEAGDNDTCGDGDYFHGRHIYSAVLFSDLDATLEPASFYVSMYYPKVWIQQTLVPGQQVEVRIFGTRRPHDKGSRNNYAVEIASASDPENIFTQDCISIGKDETAVSYFPYPSTKRLSVGNYIIKINEQTNEGGISSIGRGGCTAEFTYYWIKIQVRDQAYWDKNKNAKATVEIIPDPNGSDVPGAKKRPRAPLPPCADNDRTTLSPDTTDTCSKLKTAIGDIETAPEKFIGSVFGVVLGLSGGIALLLIIYSGYQLMASQGNPEKLQAARDQLISAIIGLVFIIFSLVILQIIGVDILKIPGFSE